MTIWKGEEEESGRKKEREERKSRREGRDRKKSREGERKRREGGRGRRVGKEKGRGGRERKSGEEGSDRKESERDRVYLSDSAKQGCMHMLGRKGGARALLLHTDVVHKADNKLDNEDRIEL